MRFIIMMCLLSLFSLGVCGCTVHEDVHDGDHHDDWAHHDDEHHDDADHHDVAPDHP